ncbi:MAG: hypothetical protein Q7U56_04895 [Humidesulfovibrio sp.]|nr:hypothetical protein [Humidesulfovibrio sp.]
MNPSFLFFLFLVLLIAVGTAADVLSWSDAGRVPPVKIRKRTQATGFVCQGSVEDRKKQ